MAAESAIYYGTLNLLVQVSAIVVGWIVVHKLSASRDRDKARREMIAEAADGLSDDVLELLLDAKRYHTEVRDVQLEEQIKMALQDISIRTSSIYQISSDKSELAACRAAIISMKRAISSCHFEDEHVAPLLATGEQVQSIVSEALRVKQSLLRLKHSQFPA